MPKDKKKAIITPIAALPEKEVTALLKSLVDLGQKHPSVHKVTLGRRDVVFTFEDSDSALLRKDLKKWGEARPGVLIEFP